MIANTLIAVFGTAIVGFTSVTCYLGYKAAQRSYYNMTIPHPQLIINNIDATNPKVYMVSNGVPIHVLCVSHEGLDKVFPYQTTTKSVLTADDFEPIVQFQVKPEEIVEYDGSIYLNYFEEKCKKADVSTHISWMTPDGNIYSTKQQWFNEQQFPDWTKGTWMNVALRNIYPRLS